MPKPKVKARVSIATKLPYRIDYLTDSNPATLTWVTCPDGVQRMFHFARGTPQPNGTGTYAGCVAVAGYYVYGHLTLTPTTATFTPTSKHERLFE